MLQYPRIDLEFRDRAGEDLSWERQAVGTPSLWREGDTWYLFYHGYGKRTGSPDDCQLGVAVGKDGNGHSIFKADRTKVTIQDVIAVEGPRLPDVDHSQKKFNTGIVVVVEHGQKPSHDLIKRANAIRQQWIDYWETTTGHRASMTATPK